MAEHATGPVELIEVKAEDIMPERQDFYGAYMAAQKYAVIGVAALLILMAIFLL